MDDEVSNAVERIDPHEQNPINGWEQFAVERNRLKESHAFDERIEIGRGLGVENECVEGGFGKMGWVNRRCKDSKVVV